MTEVLVIIGVFLFFQILQCRSERKLRGDFLVRPEHSDLCAYRKRENNSLRVVHPTASDQFLDS